MDNDTISRQATKDAINEHLKVVTSELGNDSEVKKIYKMAYSHVIDAISILPAIQPEQKIGRWIEDCGDLHCSVCGFRNSDHYCLGKGIACPNCGAFMPDGLKNVLG